MNLPVYSHNRPGRGQDLLLIFSELRDLELLEEAGFGGQRQHLKFWIYFFIKYFLFCEP